MKRDIFNITCSNGEKASVFTWNASLRKVEDMVREVARREGRFYELTSAASSTDAGRRHTAGTRVWTSGDGRELSFTIQKETPGHICECGRRVEYSDFVFANWETTVRHTCLCGVRCGILRGEVVPV